MYVCICNAIRDTELRQAAVRCRTSSAEQLYAALGRPPQCRQCIDDAEDIVGEARRALCPAAALAH